MPSVNPATEEEICRVQEAGEADVDAAVAAAHDAFQPHSAWRKLEPHERGMLLSKLADLIDLNKEYLAELEALDAGKPAKMALWVDASTAPRLLRYYSGWPDKLTGSTLPVAGGGLSYSRYEPVGVVAAILPFNFPTLGAVTKMAPALAAGNTIIVKPAEQTPLGALFLASLVKEAGFPPGVFNVLNGPGEVTGAALVRHPLVRKVTFTGSTGVGKLIQKQAADSMKRVTLELGGKNACIVLDDADLDTAVRIASGGNYFNSGQVSRSLVRPGAAIRRSSRQRPQRMCYRRSTAGHTMNAGFRCGAHGGESLSLDARLTAAQLDRAPERAGRNTAALRVGASIKRSPVPVRWRISVIGLCRSAWACLGSLCMSHSMMPSSPAPRSVPASAHWATSGRAATKGHSARRSSWTACCSESMALPCRRGADPPQPRAGICLR
jgi:hypothetical protein